MGDISYIGWVTAHPNYFFKDPHLQIVLFGGTEI